MSTVIVKGINNRLYSYNPDKLILCEYQGDIYVMERSPEIEKFVPYGHERCKVVCTFESLYGQKPN